MHKRKTTNEIDEFIVETAASGIYYEEDIAAMYHPYPIAAIHTVIIHLMDV